jgi:release factor glutamine methyltransferase
MADSYKTILYEAKQALSKVSKTPQLDAELLLCHVLNCQRSYLYAHPDCSLNHEQEKSFFQLIARRQKGEPIAYLLRYHEFWSLRLTLSSQTLIPRPETECLVEWILKQFSNDSIIELADLGTGTGAIALALASERPHWKITATDRSLSALEIAKQNAARLHLLNVTFCQGDWCSALVHQQYDLIVSNPPYIAENDPHLLDPNLQFEPLEALVSGEDGLNALREIINKANAYLKTSGYLVLEHGYDQADRVIYLLQENGFHSYHSEKDHAGIPRFVVGQKG